MKKTVLTALLVFGITSFCFSSGNKEMEFDSTPTIFEGEWKSYAVHNKTGEIQFLSFHFTGNRYEQKRNDEIISSGLFVYNEKRKEINFLFDNGNTQKYSYSQYDITFIIQGAVYKKQPHFDIMYNLWRNIDGSFDNFPVNEAELASIQGIWRHTNPQVKGSTYTFSGNEFILNNRFVGKVITGTVKINDGMLIFIANDEPFGIFYYDFRPNNEMYLTSLVGLPDSFYGPFTKQ